MVGDFNVFNIRKGSMWIGSHGFTRGFVDFDSVDYCIRAAWIIICQSYRRRGILTISDIINTFAPPKENNTDAYIAFVCKHVSSFPFDIPKSKYEFACLLSVMSLYEVGYNDYVSADMILNVINKFKLDVYKCSK